MILARCTALVLLLLFSTTIVWAKVPAKVDVVIIGAGVSGLATAYELKKAGIPYRILEISPRIGGRVRTVRYRFPGEAELYADSGMEEYWESNPAVKIIRELKLPTRTDIAGSSLMIGGKLELMNDDDTLKFLQRILTTDEYNSLEKFKAKVAPMAAQVMSGGPIPPELMKLKDISFAQWAMSQGISKRVGEWIRISIECEIGTGWDRLSALDGLEEFHIFLGKGELSYRVVGGNEKFTDALAKQIGRENVSLGQRVNRIVSHDGKAFVYYLDQSTNHEGVIQANYVVSTIPLYRLFEVQFEPALSAKKREAIVTQSWGSYFKAHVFVSAEAFTKYFSGKKGSSALPLLSDSELGVVYDGNPDQKTKTKIVSLLVTGDYAESFNMKPLDEVRAQITAGFERLWPGFAKEIKGVEFYRFHPRAIAGWPVGRSRYDDLSNEVRRMENQVYLSGDFTEGTHSSGAFASAERVAKDIIAREQASAQRSGSPIGTSSEHLSAAKK